MSSWLLIVFVICSLITFGCFPSKFSTFYFHKCILSSWLASFSLAIAIIFLLLPSFTVFHAILDYLSSAESLILKIWFCMNSVSSFCAFLSFWVLILVGFLQLNRDEVFTSASFFNRYCLILYHIFSSCLDDMHSAVASKWALTNFSYSSFRVIVSDISWSASNLFLSVNVYLSLISILLSRGQVIVYDCAVFLRILSCIFAVTIRWLEDTPSKEEYASQFNEPLF